MPSHAEGGNPCDCEETEWPAKVVLVGPEQVLGAMESGLPVQSERQNLLAEPLASSFHPDLTSPFTAGLELLVQRSGACTQLCKHILETLRWVCGQVRC